MFEVRKPDDRRLFEELNPDEIVARYRENYSLGPEIGINEVRLHADLEASLTDRLLSAPLAERGAIFEEAYSELYKKLPWLASVGTASGLEAWPKLMKPNSKVYEIGSGTGALAEYLARTGFDCTATEITQERGERDVSTVGGLRWRRTDGVHLDQFEEPGSFDYLISDQVVEHLHPDDIITHFRTALILLKPGGSYIVRTPHRRHGPQDLSRVFKLENPVFMHLHEFNFLEFDYICRESGYSDVLGVMNLGPISRKLDMYKPTHGYYSYMRVLDSIDNSLSSLRIGRKAFKGLSRYLLSPKNVWVKLVR